MHGRTLMSKFYGLMVGAAALAMVSSAEAAVSYSYTGTLPANDPNSFALFSFTVLPGEQDAKLVTYGYAGGTNAEGVAIEAGGFDPIISLFDSSFATVAFSDDGSLVVDPVSGESFDGLIELTLNPGTYYVAVTSFANFPLASFLDGFQGGGSFIDITGLDRTTAYALDIVLTPVPAALPLLAAGLGGLALAARRRRG